MLSNAVPTHESLHFLSPNHDEVAEIKAEHTAHDHDTKTMTTPTKVFSKKAKACASDSRKS